MSWQRIAFVSLIRRCCLGFTKLMLLQNEVAAAKQQNAIGLSEKCYQMCISRIGAMSLGGGESV